MLLAFGSQWRSPYADFMPITRRIAGFLFLISLFIAQQSAAQTGRRQQRRFIDRQGRAYFRGPLRATFGAGATLYNGDLASGLADNFPGVSLNLGLLYRLRPHLVVGAEAGYFHLGARDQAPERGLAFQSDNGLGTVFLRYELLRDGTVYVTNFGDEAPRIQPYVQAGAGLLLYNPKAYFGRARPTASTAFLAPERNDYPALAAVLPVAAGLSVRATNQVSVGLQGTYYFTSTDHLDDVSARGNPNHNDGFGTLEVKLEYKLGL